MSHHGSENSQRAGWSRAKRRSLARCPYVEAMEGRLLLQAGSWTSAANLPQPLFNVDATTAPDGQVYVIGDGGNGPNGLYVYTPATNSWSETR